MAGHKTTEQQMDPFVFHWELIIRDIYRGAEIIE